MWIFFLMFHSTLLPYLIFYKWSISTLSAFGVFFSFQFNLSMLFCNYQLKKIVTALPRRLVVFVTHHHRDHVDGKSLLKH